MSGTLPADMLAPPRVRTEAPRCWSEPCRLFPQDSLSKNSRLHFGNLVLSPTKGEDS